MRTEGLSERRSCSLAGLNRATYQYNPKPKDDVHIRERLKELAVRRLHSFILAKTPKGLL
jgi:hypothetical protein